MINPVELKEEVYKNGETFLEAGMANFGHIDYGSSILGQVFVPIINKNGCDPFTEKMFDWEA